MRKRQPVAVLFYCAMLDSEIWLAGGPVVRANMIADGEQRPIFLPSELGALEKKPQEHLAAVLEAKRIFGSETEVVPCEAV